MEPKYPQGGDLLYKAPHPESGLAGLGAGRGREVLGALNSEETSQAGALQDLEPDSEQEPEPQRRPRPFPIPQSCSLPWMPGPCVPRTQCPPWEGRAGGTSPRAPLRLQCSGPVARAPPQPAGAPRPSPSWLSPPSLGTMAAPSRHLLPPAGLALYLPDKAGRAAGPRRGLQGRTPPREA